MKRTTLFAFLFSFVSASMFAQVSVSPPVQTVSGQVDMTDIEAKFTVSNGDAAQDIRWALEVGSDWPEDWQAWACDENLCYSPTVLTDPQGTSLESRESQSWSLHCNPVGVAAVGTVFLHITDEASGDTLTTVEVVYNTTTTSAGEIEPTTAVRLYPNPTTEFFMIDSDSEVQTVQLYDLVGRELLSSKHQKGQQYNVTDLRQGIYLVRMLDDQGEVIKSARLSKR